MAGCSHDTIPGCWLTAARITLTAHASGTLRGRAVECGPLRCQQVGRGVLVIPGDGTYRSPSGDAMCAGGATRRLPDEIGTVRPARGGKLRLRASNRAELRRTLRQCGGRRVSLTGGGWIKLSADRRELTGFARTHVTIFDELPLEETVISRVIGRLGVPPDPIVLQPNARLCPRPLRLQCVAR